MTDTVPARRALLALLLDRIDRDALLPAERPLLRALVTAEQDDAPAPTTRPVITPHDEATSAAVRPLLNDLDAMRRRAERAERLLDSARKARLCGDCRINLDGAIDDAQATADDAQATADRAALDNAIVDDIARRAVEGDGTGQMLGLVGLGVATPVDRCRVLPSRTCPPSYGSCGDRPCARFETDDPTPWTTSPAAAAAPPPQCTATITAMDHVNPDRIIRCEKPTGHYDFDDRPAPEIDALSTGGWHSSDGGKRVWADQAPGATPATDAPSEPQP